MLDLIRLGEGRWLARAVTQFDGEMVVLEEVLECDSLPCVEAVIDLDAEPARLVLRHRDAPAIVLAARQLEMTGRCRSKISARVNPAAACRPSPRRRRR